jgi:hypothetical protein
MSAAEGKGFDLTPAKVLTAITRVFIATSLGACTAMGPMSVPHDRIEYSTSIGDSWKKQTLLNIVKLRYGDVPSFLEVAQVVAGYQFQTAIGGSVTAANGNAALVGPLTVGGSATAANTYTDRPTVVYAPLTGTDFLKALMTPIPPHAVLFMLQSGYAATQLLPIVLDSINGLTNASLRQRRLADPTFERLVTLLLEAQLANALQIRIDRPKEGPPTSVIVFRQSTDPQAVAMGQEVRRLLGLRPDVLQLNVYYGGYAGRDDEIDMATRSMLQIMLEFAAMVRVPAFDVTQQRATPGLTDANAANPRAEDAIRIVSTASRPNDAYVAVEYGNRWFWIADTDIRSKLTFASLMLLFSLSDTGVAGSRPVVTIPTNQ